MKLSVCIFTFNHEDYITEAVESALRQETDFDFEIVIGEDASTDRTREIVKHYHNKYPDKVRPLYRSANVGQMDNSVDTILQSRGEYVALLDGDDYWISSKKLQAQVDFLDAHSKYVVCFHDAKILNSNGRWDDSTCCGPDHQSIALRNDITFNNIICDVHIPTSSVVFRKSALMKDYPPKWLKSLHATDRPMFLLLTANGPAYYFNELWGVYRKHLNGFWTSRSYLPQWLIHLQIYQVLNKHYNYKHHKAFCACESRVSHVLAVNLIKEGKFRRALCFFRRYIRSNELLPIRFKVYAKIIEFGLLYAKARLLFYKK